ncbi:MAG: ScyD/ScyE family protein [Actinobacteria bacterium]|nr:ScyD/ScyE family protein [Actinomycetota bacterium]
MNTSNGFGAGGRLLGHLLTRGPDGRLRVGADLARFEAAHDPDHGRGGAAGDAIESDPYALAAYRGGYAVADAAGNDVLWVGPTGAVRVLAVLPTQTVPAPAGTMGGTARRVAVQSVPTSVAVGGRRSGRGALRRRADRLPVRSGIGPGLADRPGGSARPSTRPGSPTSRR